MAQTVPGLGNEGAGGDLPWPLPHALSTRSARSPRAAPVSPGMAQHSVPPMASPEQRLSGKEWNPRAVCFPVHHFAPNATFSLHIAELTWSNLPFLGSAVEDGIMYYVQDVIAFDKRISTFTTLPQHSQSQALLTRAAI